MRSEEFLSEALLAALSRAAALPLHRSITWPPAAVRPLDRREIADELRHLQDLGRGHELAVVALAELGDAADPALRAELAAHARDEFAGGDLSKWPASVGAALQRRALDGLRVDFGARTLQVDWLRPHVSRGEGHVHVALRYSRCDGQQRVRGRVRLPSELARARTLAPDWRARAEAALRSALAAPPDEPRHPEEIADDLLRALLPDTVDGRAGWLLTRGLELLGAGAQTPLVTADRDGKQHALYLLSAEHETSVASYGGLRLLLRVVTREGATIVDVYEREVFSGTLAPEDYTAPAPTDEAIAVAAVEAWRAAARQYLARDDVRLDAEFLFYELPWLSRPLVLIATWLAEGPPGPPPEPPPPRAEVTEARLAAAAARVRLLDEAETEALRASVDDQLLAALELDGWTALFCPCHRPEPGTFQEDRIRLRPPGGEAATILMSDPWNGHVMPIDGDAALFRIVAGFWRELLVRAGLDVAFSLPRDDDDDDEYDEGPADDGSTSLRAWLEFPLPDSSPPFPAIDWRVYDDRDRDFIADFNFWERGPFAMSPERRAQYESAIATHYHAYVHAVIDPEFTPRGGAPTR